MNECAENATLCEKGTYCDNVPGTYECKGTRKRRFVIIIMTNSFLCIVCDPACGTACVGEGSQGCIDCAAGYQINGTSGCDGMGFV